MAATEAMQEQRALSCASSATMRVTKASAKAAVLCSESGVAVFKARDVRLAWAQGSGNRSSSKAPHLSGADLQVLVSKTSAGTSRIRFSP